MSCYYAVGHAIDREIVFATENRIALTDLFMKSLPESVMLFEYRAHAEQYLQATTVINPDTGTARTESALFKLYKDPEARAHSSKARVLNMEPWKMVKSLTPHTNLWREETTIEVSRHDVTVLVCQWGIKLLYLQLPPHPQDFTDLWRRYIHDMDDSGREAVIALLMKGNLAPSFSVWRAAPPKLTPEKRTEEAMIQFLESKPTMSADEILAWLHGEKQILNERALHTGRKEGELLSKLDFAIKALGGADRV